MRQVRVAALRPFTLAGYNKASAMKLETHEGTFADPAQPEDVALAVAGLTRAGEAFVVLSDGDYLRSAAWSEAITWHRVRFDQDPAEA